MAVVANQVHSTAQQIDARSGWNRIDAATQPPCIAFVLTGNGYSNWIFATCPYLRDSEGRKYGLVYRMNSDVKAIALSFGNDISKRNGNDKWELPIPGTFVIDTKGVVRFAHVDPNFMTGSANPEAVLDVLTKLLRTERRKRLRVANIDEPSILANVS